MLLNVHGIDLEIKIEWDNDGNTTSSRFYKGWRLDYVFDYNLGNSGDVYNPSSNITVYAKWNETDDWYSSSQKIRHGNQGWDWCFNEGGADSKNHTQTMIMK